MSAAVVSRGSTQSISGRDRCHAPSIGSPPDFWRTPGPIIGGTASASLASRVMEEKPATWDRAMMARLVAGDDSALGPIFDQYGALVHGIAARLVGSDAAADVTQEVFLKLWENPMAFNADVGGLRTYLGVMARRRAIDALRRTGRRALRE